MSSIFLFSDRASAGETLARTISEKIAELNIPAAENLNPIVYALPRGGVPVAVPVARSLACPLEVVVAKKITPPSNPELAIGAVTADGCIVWSNHKPHNLRLQEALVEVALAKARKQLQILSPGCPGVNPEGKLAILVDDGIATGMTMVAAARSLKLQKSRQIWICVPVAPPEAIALLREESDRTIVLQTPDPFLSVSRFYLEFEQVQTKLALACLQQQKQWLEGYF